ncbi:hypothetical protein L1987_62611 [Smallanthus sonchifolius]|uniref:Uncharacterized protein n=1 Tax=Smallanthus sonchifolius TaxID=185202 RepID=A0ACB9CAW5_9ASTR|nr:hypothetical protein L1987_62611 [Smallanthus sonchifolius]
MTNWPYLDYPKVTDRRCPLIKIVHRMNESPHLSLASTTFPSYISELGEDNSQIKTVLDAKEQLKPSLTSDAVNSSSGGIEKRDRARAKFSVPMATLKHPRTQRNPFDYPFVDSDHMRKRARLMEITDEIISSVMLLLLFRFLLHDNVVIYAIEPSSGLFYSFSLCDYSIDLSVEDGHLCNMGKLIEELERKPRNQLDQDLCSSSYVIQLLDGLVDLSVEDGHLCNMGKLIEELERKPRNQLDQDLCSSSYVIQLLDGLDALLEADIHHANAMAAAIPRAKDGARFQMKLVYNELAPLVMFLLQWIDSSCTCLLPRYLNLVHVLVYKVYTDGRPKISRHGRKASISDFYAVILPSLRRLHCDLVELNYPMVGACKRESSGLEISSKKKPEKETGLKNLDLERENECGICLESCAKIVLPKCCHAMCINCYRDWKTRSSSCPFCRGDIKRVKSRDLWVLTCDDEVVDADLVVDEDLVRFYLYMNNLPKDHSDVVFFMYYEYLI